MNIVPGLLNLELVERGRLLALLISSNIALWFIIFYLRNSLIGQRIQFDSLVRAIGAEKYEKDLELKLGQMKIAVLIPSFNEAKNLRELLPKIPHDIHGEKVGVLVVDDGSDDSTYKTARES